MRRHKTKNKHFKHFITMPLPAIPAIIAAISSGALAADVGAKLIYRLIQADRHGKKAVNAITNPDDSKGRIQKKLEDFDWSKFTQQQAVPYYGNHINIKTLGGKSVLYDGNHSVSRWLFR